MKQEIPYVAFSSDELASCDPLDEFIECVSCGRDHRVITSHTEDGEANLSFLKCETFGTTLLVGVMGKDVRPLLEARREARDRERKRITAEKERERARRKKEARSSKDQSTTSRTAS